MKKVKEIRKRLGVRQGHLCSLLEIAQPTFSHMEAGRWVPNDIEYIRKQALNELFSISVDNINKLKEQIAEIESIHDDIVCEMGENKKIERLAKDFAKQFIQPNLQKL